ncbi:hypothetical protein [Salinibacterium sp. ZJ454]|uniref:hypothetical protein n=1 Tax=Salinibacterium sp. ZJ454 TaxID=2708339 RepID=UPI001420AF05|nr:hypothetical protein [Salinibacterium sp. ZJ454]
MTVAMGVAAKRILFKEITAADIRKLRAESNDSKTGGGARDLRLPFSEFDGVIRQLLPRTVSTERRRNGRRVLVDIRVGSAKYYADASSSGTSRDIDLTWEPPTTVRPREGRIPRVHQSLNLPESGVGRVFFLLVQDESGVLGAHYAYEEDLRAGRWQADVAAPILRGMDDPSRPKRLSVQGYIDYTTNTQYCHGVD